MNKKKILIANDAHWLGTGYGVYGKELLTRLHNTGKYEIAEIACYGSPEACKHHAPPWKIYPNIPSKTDREEVRQRFAAQQPVAAFGAWRFNEILLHFQPDIVFDVRDYWMYAFQESNLFRPFYKWVVMPTVDSAPQNKQWLSTFRNIDLVVPYTEWAFNTLEYQCGPSINLFPKIANAGVDTQEFRPLSAEEKRQHKIEMYGYDYEITGVVMRNQKRKLFPNVLSSYRAYLDRLIQEENFEKYRKSFLYLHTSYPEINGWDLAELLVENRLTEKVFMTSMCNSCEAVFATKFRDGPGICPNCKQRNLVHCNPQLSVPTNALVKIYQSFDMLLQVAICEGFGMPQIEAAACGVPVASVDYSAMSEIVRKLEGYPIPVKTLFRELETGADRALPDGEALTEIIRSYFSLTEEERNIKSERTRELCKRYYTWDQVAEVWDEALSSVDISSNKKWDCEKRETNNVTVPSDLSAYDFVNFIVSDIIQEPWLMRTPTLLRIVQDLTHGYNSRGEKVDHKSSVQQLQNIMQNKINLEELRTNLSDAFKKETFLNV